MFTRTMHQSTTPILVTDYLTKMGIKTVPHPSYSQDLAPCDFWLFLKLRGCHYETIEEMKEAMTKVIDTFTQEDFHGAFQKLLEWYKCIVVRRDYFKGDQSFMCVLSIKVPIRKTNVNLFNDPRIQIMLCYRHSIFLEGRFVTLNLQYQGFSVATI